MAPRSIGPVQGSRAVQIISATIQGFRSFASQQEINFSKLRPGLFHLGGKNEVEPDISPNGAGKSSLLEAVCWLLYGTTSRKLKAGATKNWNSKEQCGGIIEVKTAQNELGIFRTWNPNTLEVAINGADPRPIDQKELDALLGLSFEAYLFSIYFAQFAPAFIDLKPAEQMSIFSTVLGLDLWETAADASAKFGRDLEGTVTRQKETLAGLRGQLEATNDAIRRLDPEEQEWLKSMVAREEELTKAVQTAKKSSKAAEAERDRHVEGSAEFRRLRELEGAAARVVAVAEAEVRRLEAEAGKLSGKEKVTKCPACGGPISVAHLKQEKERTATALKTAKEKSAEAKQAHDVQMKAMTAVRDSEVKLLEAERVLASAKGQQSAAERELEQLLKAENPFDKRRADAHAKVDELMLDIEGKDKKLGETEQAQGAAVFWSKGFKELRLSLIEESLAQLSIEANSALVELGLKEWALEFDVERETKKGTVSKGFTILVRAPHVKEAVPWECWSGGESQRLRVAASAGFSELICARAGVAPNVEFWDEPSQWLSENGIHDLLSTLADRAERRKKVIILADHRALDFGGFSGSITVVKKAAGSVLSVS